MPIYEFKCSHCNVSTEVIKHVRSEIANTQKCKCGGIMYKQFPTGTGFDLTKGGKGFAAGGFHCGRPQKK